MKELETGFYWCKLFGEWEIMYFEDDYWYSNGIAGGYTETQLDEIDERKILRK